MCIRDSVGIIDHGELIAIGTQKELTQQMGETETLILHISENDDQEALAAALKTVHGVLEAEPSENIVSIITPEAEDILAAVITKATERGVKIRSIDIR